MSTIDAAAASSSSGLLFRMTGSYVLERYDDRLEAWLDSLKISGVDLGPVFRTTGLKLIVKEPTKHNNSWSITHKEEGPEDTEGGTSFSVTYSFETGKTFTPESVSTTSDCSEPSSASACPEKVICFPAGPTALICQSSVARRGWIIESRIQFRPDGIAVTYINKRANVATTATYRKQNDPWAGKKGKLKLVTIQ